MTDEKLREYMTAIALETLAQTVGVNVNTLLTPDESSHLSDELDRFPDADEAMNTRSTDILKTLLRESIDRLLAADTPVTE